MSIFTSKYQEYIDDDLDYDINIIQTIQNKQDKYSVIRELGHGAFGEVFCVKDIQNKELALK